MYEKKLPVKLDCGHHLFLAVIAGKWKVNLLWFINSGIKRPGELQKELPKASRRLLDSQLSELVVQGIITKEIFDERPPKVEYSLTPLGKSLLEVIKSTAQWGETNRDALQPFFQFLPSNRL